MTRDPGLVRRAREGFLEVVTFEGLGRQTGFQEEGAGPAGHQSCLTESGAEDGGLGQSLAGAWVGGGIGLGAENRKEVSVCGEVEGKAPHFLDSNSGSDA